MFPFMSVSSKKKSRWSSDLPLLGRNAEQTSPMWNPFLLLRWNVKSFGAVFPLRRRFLCHYQSCPKGFTKWQSMFIYSYFFFYECIHLQITMMTGCHIPSYIYSENAMKQAIAPSRVFVSWERLQLCIILRAREQTMKRRNKIPIWCSSKTSVMACSSLGFK